MLKNAALLLLLLLVAGCSQSLYMQGRKHIEQGQYDRAIDEFYEELKVNPESHKAWRELGIAFYKKGNLIKAEDALKQANNIRPDARTNLYIGLIFEKKRQYGKAIAAYAASLNLKTEGKIKTLIRAHLDRLIAQKFKHEATLAIENELDIDTDTIPENTIAVVDFDGSQLPPELAPISMGLAEFTSIDLSKVSDLRVVDRLKINVLLDELKLSSSKSSDPNYAPRVGRLLGSSRIITGSVLGAGDNMIRLDGVIVNTTDSSSDLTGPSEGTLERFFKLQKDFVFKVIDSLGITLTLEERDAIQEVPTESFLAFMAYSRGLNYQRLGMYDAARREFQKASSEDRNFHQANRKLQRLSRAPEQSGEAEGSVETFELSVTSESESERHSGGLDRIQTGTLANAGFLHEPHTFDRYDESSTAPPDTESRTGIVVIRGNFDAD